MLPYLSSQLMRCVGEQDNLMLTSMATPRLRGTTSRRSRSAVSLLVVFPLRIPASTLC